MPSRPMRPSLQTSAPCASTSLGITCIVSGAAAFCSLTRRSQRTIEMHRERPLCALRAPRTRAKRHVPAPCDSAVLCGLRVKIVAANRTAQSREAIPQFTGFHSFVTGSPSRNSIPPIAATPRDQLVQFRLSTMMTSRPVDFLVCRHRNTRLLQLPLNLDLGNNRRHPACRPRKPDCLRS